MIEFLEKYSDWIKQADLISWVSQNVNWAFTKFLYQLSKASEELIDQVFSVFGFLNNSVVKKVFDSMQVIAFGILVIAVMWIGFRLIFNNKVDLKNAGLRAMIYSCLLLQLPTVMDLCYDASKTFYDETGQVITSNNVEGESMSFNIVKENTADINYIAYQGFDKLLEESTVKNKLTEKQFGLIKLATILNVKDLDKLQKDSENDEVENLKYYLVGAGSGDEVETKEIKNGFFDWFDEGTFRYTGNFSVMNISFLVMIIYNILLFSKFIFIAIDLVMRKVTFPILAFSDLETGERPKKAVEGIFSSFFTIGLMGISRALFVTYYAYIMTLDMNIVGIFICGIIGLVAFLKGSDAIARQFGIDTGLKEGVAGIAGMYGAYRLARQGAQAAKGAGDKAKDVASKAPEKARKSVRAAQDGLENSAGKVGSAVGNISEQGVSGFLNEQISTVKDNVGGKIQSAAAASTQPVKNIKEAFDEGVDSGISSGANNRAKLAKNNDSDSSEASGEENYPTRAASSDVPSSHRAVVDTGDGNDYPQRAATVPYSYPKPKSSMGYTVAEQASQSSPGTKPDASNVDGYSGPTRTPNTEAAAGNSNSANSQSKQPASSQNNQNSTVRDSTTQQREKDVNEQVSERVNTNVANSVQGQEQKTARNIESSTQKISSERKIDIEEKQTVQMQGSEGGIVVPNTSNTTKQVESTQKTVNNVRNEKVNNVNNTNNANVNNNSTVSNHQSNTQVNKGNTPPKKDKFKNLYDDL
ncbi:hypothetical protein M2139_001495 [Enterococcus sp. PF1-24]|uniref:pLS20_p028 family conjugation system transmembrane protein n=1 Tax=unclassified Enterococcus TaxID=2608891 RepID=UPI002474C3D9|nr:MULTISPECIES: hypothetical protein [unclassified Enterococcus]MDH6364514.1 hypothetical protein [Enterococcus sp. PFB1-1]MDH6401609.1 hypothetical protein [Enterococcus sp. PF1-24]